MKSVIMSEAFLVDVSIYSHIIFLNLVLHVYNHMIIYLKIRTVLF